jgi:hypothetical protein
VSRASDIIDQDIDPAEAIEAGFHHGLDRSCVGDVASVGYDLAARCLCALNSLTHAVEVTIDGKDFCAFLDKTYSGSAAIAPTWADAPSAGYDRYPVPQSPAHDAGPVRERARAKR